MRVRRRAAMAVAGLVGVLTSVVVGTMPAAAHVSIDPREAVQGGYATLAFRVPNERDDASIVKIELAIPADSAIASVSARPMPGWTVQVKRDKLPSPLKGDDGEVTEAVSRIGWTASKGNEVGPGQFQEFEISAGPLPVTDRIVFKVLQTYSTGEVVRWIEEPPTKGEEPEHPAPVLKLTAGSDTDHHATSGESAHADAAGDQSAGTAGGEGGTPWALVAGLIGLVAGLLGMFFGYVAWRRTGPTS